MFFGHTKEWKLTQAYLPRPFVAALDELLSLDLMRLKPDRYPMQSINGAFCLIQEMSSKILDAARPEAHTRYIDIQYLISGVERMGVAPCYPVVAPVEERWKKDDIAFFQNPPREFFIDLNPCDFVIFAPGEIHRPCVCLGSPAPLRKAVIKIPRL